MKKYFLIAIAFLSVNFFGYSQGVGSNTDLPVILPQSPDAYQLGKYGEVPINESTGAVNLSIPLAEYTVGDIKVPIAMNYSGNGVKVQQMPTWSGVNWALSSGGVITREVRDRPDELVSYRTHYEKDYLIEIDTTKEEGRYQQGEWAEKIFELSNDVNVDSEVDIFNYNFPGYSGSFYLDSLLLPHLIKYDKEVKVEFYLNTNNDSYFRLTSPEGMQYYFGGDQASNVSRGISGPGAENKSDINQAAFFLYKIISPKGNEVNFSYQEIQNLENNRSESRTHTTGVSAADGSAIDT